MQGDTRESRVTRLPNILDDNSLQTIANQPGVIAISAFFEGFSLKSFGTADFEHIAAIAEDFLRAAKNIAGDINLGKLDQVILEAGESKCIIAPYGDLYLCILTSPKANLGLIRLAIRNLQAKAGV